MNSLVPPGALRDLLREAFGSGVEVVGSAVLNRRDDYLVLRVELRRPSQTVMVKLAGPGAAYPCPFDRTAAVQDLVRRRTSVPLAEIVAVDVSYRRWPWRYLIAEAVPGVEWATVRRALDARGVADAQREIGDAVGQLHTIYLPAFGDIDPACASAPVAPTGSSNATARPRWARLLLRRTRRPVLG